MYPYIHIGSFQLGTFGLLLWLAAVAGTMVLHRAFTRRGVDADALNVVAMVVIFGVIGSKLWHELQDPAGLAAAMRQIFKSGQTAWQVTLNFLHWFQTGFAWYGGLLAGIAMLLYQGHIAHFRGPQWTPEDSGVPGPRLGGLRMLDLAAPAAAVGYGVGRIGCLTSGDGDYGRNTTSTFWGVHLAPNALVPPHPANALVLPTPLWELAAALVIAAILWKLAERYRPIGWLTGMYLVLSGAARFAVEFWRINPKLYWGMSNAQVAALGSILVGLIVLAAAQASRRPWLPAQAPIPATAT
jgi:phosphatidylglycerol:prolipoprotein diacylglycerol transferase